MSRSDKLLGEKVLSSKEDEDCVDDWLGWLKRESFTCISFVNGSVLFFSIIKLLLKELKFICDPVLLFCDSIPLELFVFKLEAILANWFIFDNLHSLQVFLVLPWGLQNAEPVQGYSLHLI